MSSTASLRSRRSRKARAQGAAATPNVEPVMRRLAVAITGLELPAVEKISQSREEDPFQVTIATLLSARTQDATTYAASERLFSEGGTPQAMAKLTVKQIEKLIYPVSFYRYKARYIKATCAKLLEGFRRQDALDDGGAADAAGRRTQDGEPGVDPRVRRARRTSASTRTSIASRTGWAGCARRRRTRRSRRCIARPSRDGGRTSISISSRGDRMCAGPCIRDARRARSRICARASA